MLIVADDPPRNERELKAGEMACPDCKGELRPWVHARPRRLRMLSGSRVIRPRRSCCRACGSTHVLIPGVMLPRRADGIRVIGKALLEHVAGHGHRPIAARLRRPAATVRGWIRAFAARAEQTLGQASLWMLRLDVRVVRIEPDPTATPGGSGRRGDGESGRHRGAQDVPCGAPVGGGVHPAGWAAAGQHQPPLPVSGLS